MSIYGYCRVSTKKQSIERQTRNIAASYPDALMITEEYTGTTMERPKWGRLLKMVKAGDTIVFDSVSRMSRDAAEGFRVYRELMEQGVELVFLKEHHIDTAVYRRAENRAVPLTGTTVDHILKGINEYLMCLAEEQIQLAFEQSEKEVTDLHQRTVEGLVTARINGKQLGRPIGTTGKTKKQIRCEELIRKYSRDWDGMLKDEEVRKLCGISENTYYKYKRML